VRRALTYAVDRERLVQGALAGAGEPAYGPIMKGHWAYSPVAETPYDPAKAGRLLDAAGFRRTADGTRAKGSLKLKFTVMYNAADSVRKDLALAFAADMAKIGADVTPQGLSWDVIKKRQDEGATVFGYGIPYDPDLELYGLFHSKFATDADPYTNYPRTRDAKLDALLDRERATLDEPTRKRLFAGIQAEHARDASWLWLVRLRHVVAISKRVQGVDPQVEPHAHGFSRGTSWNLEDWTLGPAR
jgi:peptide/nickel transport system substrate-binding protein